MTANTLTHSLNSIAVSHSELCLGLKTLLDCGVPHSELLSVLERLCDQADELSSMSGALVSASTPRSVSAA